MQKKQYLCSLIMVTTDLHAELDRLSVSYGADRMVVLVAASVAPVWQKFFRDRFRILVLADGEENKSLDTLQRVWDFLFEADITRSGLLLCVGGGTVTDLGGLAAATYKRGIHYINIPTTLLAMVDAAVGGKTGINYRGLKNAIGAFYPPEKTIVWPEWLSTLPAEQLLSGFAEMLKTGLLADGQKIPQAEGLWQRLMQYDMERMDPAELTPLIADCIAVKQYIVTADPSETGLRKTLNLGHTFGHALEETAFAETKNGAQAGLLHGYAVLYGLIAELYLSHTLLGCEREALQQLTQRMIHYYGRPACKCTDRERIIRLMHQDKKNERATEINCTLLRSTGHPVINQIITDAQADEALEYLFSL